MRVEIAGGQVIDLGTTEAAPSIGIIDYSRRVTDDFGVTTVVERSFSRRMTVRLSVPFEQADAVQQQLASLRATAALWVADDRYSSLAIEGFYKDFSLDLNAPPISYCTLTVEGLAESAPPADAGGDPAPVGSASTLRLLQPATIASANLIASNVPEADYPEWAGATVYALGTRVIKAAVHKVYESAVGGNTGKDPEASPEWLEVGATNRWAMFDQALGSATARAGSIAVTLDVGAVSAVALLDVTAATVRVQAPGYDQTQAVAGGPVTFLNLSGAAGQVTVTVTGPGQVAVGTLLIGKLVALGVTEAAPTAEITDYSRKEVDDFGETEIVERAWAKRMTAKALIRSDAVDAVAGRIAAVRARPSLWIGETGMDSLTVYGFFKDFSIEVGEAVSKLSLSIEGMSKAPPVAPIESPPQSAIGGVLTNESHVLSADSAGAILSYSGANSGFRIFHGLEDVSASFTLATAPGGNPQALTALYDNTANPRSFSVTGGYDAAEDNASLTVRATGSGIFAGITLDKTFSLSKSKAGAAGGPGSAGAAAKLIVVSSTHLIFSYDANDVVQTQSTTITAARQNAGAETTQWRVLKVDGSVFVNWTTAATIASNMGGSTYITAPDNDTLVLNHGGFQANLVVAGSTGFVFEARLSATTTVSDRVSIVKLKDGATGAAGTPGAAGTSGLSVAEITVYKRSGSGAPATPTGGTYDFTSKTLTAVPSGWTIIAPAGTDPLYEAKGVASVQGTSGSVPPSWVGVGFVAQNGTAGTPGAPGTDGSSVDVVFQRSASQPATPAASVGTPAAWYSDLASVPAGTDPVWSSFGQKAGGVTNFTWDTPVRVQAANGVTGRLTNESHTVATAADGTGASFAGAGGTFQVFSATTEVTTSATFSILGGADAGTTWTRTQNGLTLTIDETTGVYSLSGTWTSDSEAFTLQAVYGSVTLPAIYSISKSKAGAAGAAGSPGSPGTPGTAGAPGPAGAVISIIPSEGAFSFLDGVAVNSAQTISFTATKQNTAEAVSWTSVPAGLVTGTGDSKTLSIAAFGANRQVVVTATGATTGAKDSTTIVRLDRSTAAAGAARNVTRIYTQSATQPATPTGNGIAAGWASTIGATSTAHIPIAASTNTSVSALGSGAYRITKTAGGTAHNAQSISSAAVSGDFLLKIVPGTASNDSFVGMNADPNTSTGFADIDYCVTFNASLVQPVASGVGTGYVSFTGAIWIRRIGSTLTMEYGADSTSTTVFATYTSAAALYFDSSIYNEGGEVDVTLSASLSLPIWESLAEQDAAGTTYGSWSTPLHILHETNADMTYEIVGAGSAEVVAKADGTFEAGVLAAAAQSYAVLTKGGDVTSTLTYAVATKEGAGTASIALSNGKAVLTPLTLGTTSVFEISALSGGQVRDKHTLTLTKKLAAAQSGGSGSGGGTSNSGPISGTSNSTTPIALSSVITVKAGSSGGIQCNASIEYVRQETTLGNATGAAVWRWRVVGGVFADIATAAVGSSVETIPGDPPMAGYVSCNMAKAGLANGTDYELQLWGYRSAGNGTLSFYGSGGSSASCTGY